MCIFAPALPNDTSLYLMSHLETWSQNKNDQIAKSLFIWSRNSRTPMTLSCQNERKKLLQNQPIRKRCILFMSVPKNDKEMLRFQSLTYSNLNKWMFSMFSYPLSVIASAFSIQHSFKTHFRLFGNSLYFPFEKTSTQRNKIFKNRQICLMWKCWALTLGHHHHIDVWMKYIWVINV